MQWNQCFGQNYKAFQPNSRSLTSDNITITPLSDNSSSSVWSLVSRRQLFSPTEAKPAADRRPAPTSFLVSCQLLLVLFPTFMSAVCLHFYTLYVTLFRIFRGNLKTSPKPTGNLILLNMIPKDKVDRLHSQVDHVCPDKSKFELLEAERSILGKKDGKSSQKSERCQNQRHRPRFCRKHPAKPQHPPGQPSRCF